MKRFIFAFAVVQFVGVIRPLLGVGQYFRSRHAFAAQRATIIGLLTEGPHD